MTSAPWARRRRALRDEEVAERVGGLFERHGRMVYGICRAMLRDVHEAEDATQQVFLSAHAALLGGADVRDPARWLATIARNECRGRIAAGMRTPLPVAAEDLEHVRAPDELARSERLRELCEALAALPDRQREALVLRYLYGLRYREVSAALGLSRAATEALLFRARRAVRRRLWPLAGAAFVVPSSLREELALAIPGFAPGAGPSIAAVGTAGGVLAKLAGAPGGVKVVTTAAAAVSIGTVGTVQSDRPARDGDQPAPVVRRVGPGASAAEPFGASLSRDIDRSRSSGHDGGQGTRESSGPGHGGRSGHDSGSERVEDEDTSGPGSGTSRHSGPNVRLESSDVSEESGSSGHSGGSSASGNLGGSGSSGHSGRSKSSGHSSGFGSSGHSDGSGSSGSSYSGSPEESSGSDDSGGSGSGSDSGSGGSGGSGSGSDSGGGGSEERES